PTRPARLPTTTRALKLKRLPPLTTFATRLTWTILSIYSVCSVNSSATLAPSASRGPHIHCALELQPFFSCTKRHSFNTAMIEKAIAIKDDLLYPMLQGFFCHHLPYERCSYNVSPALASRPKILAKTRRCHQDTVCSIIDDLGIDMLGATKN